MKRKLLQLDTDPHGLPDITAHDQISQAFPLHIFILQTLEVGIILE